MAKGKLLSALDRQKGRDIRLEKQRQQEKKAAKKRAAENEPLEDEVDDDEDWEDEDEDDTGVQQGGVPLSASIAALAKGIAADEAAAAAGGRDMNVDEEEEENDDEDDEDPEANDIPFSDLESLGSDDKADVVPFQRLTINNTAALLKAHRAIAADRSAPFAVYQTVTSATQTEIPDVHDDLARELAFYKQSLEAATEGRARLKKEGVPFTRPADYFAEMVKTDEHMDRIRAKMTEKESDKKAAAEARKLRDLKKFGKQVQVAKQQERDKAKRETLDKINQLKRKRNASSGDTREEDLFDVALEDAEKPAKKGRPKRDKDVQQPNHRRQYKNEKYGFGGRKRFKKSGDAVSSGDLSGFNARKMKGQTKGSKRPGKSRRAKLT